MFVFFLEHAGELHIIILRRKKGYEPLQKPTHIHASSLTQNKRNFINKETTLICAQCLLGTEVRRWVIPRALAKPQECSSSLASNKALAPFEDAPSNTLITVIKKCYVGNYEKKEGMRSRCVCCVPFSFGELVVPESTTCLENCF